MSEANAHLGEQWVRTEACRVQLWKAAVNECKCCPCWRGTLHPCSASLRSSERVKSTPALCLPGFSSVPSADVWSHSAAHDMKQVLIGWQALWSPLSEEALIINRPLHQTANCSSSSNSGIPRIKKIPHPRCSVIYRERGREREHMKTNKGSCGKTSGTMCKNSLLCWLRCCSYPSVLRTPPLLHIAPNMLQPRANNAPANALTASHGSHFHILFISAQLLSLKGCCVFSECSECWWSSGDWKNFK